ncbi:hypothetical protein NIES4106_03780 [Fischerella sp. NIES-4106]|nr:hypothetical protein NIES4106_03780 [Fischerella sp. NIES-4106]
MSIKALKLTVKKFLAENQKLSFLTKIYLKKKITQHIYFSYKHEKNILKIHNIECFQSRGLSTSYLLLDSMKEVKKKLKKNVEFIVHTGDYPSFSSSKIRQYAYCCDKIEDVKYVIPDFVYGGWAEAGISDYSKIVEQIEVASSNKLVDDRIFWIGNSDNSPKRKSLLEISEKHPDIVLAIDTKVDKVINHKSEFKASQLNYYSIPDHCKFKFLIDIEGVGYSGRLKLFLFTKRVVFIQERNWKEWFHFDLEPYKHFVPVKNDLSDLIEKYQEIKFNCELYQEITSNAYNFAQANLTYDMAIKRLTNILEKDFI